MDLCCRRVGLVLFGLILLLSGAYGSIRSVAAQDGSDWLAAAAPALSKVTDLPDNTLPASNNVDCSPMSYTPPGRATQILCTFQSPLGVVTTSGQLVTGVNKLVDLDGQSYASFFVPTVDPSIGVVSVNSSNIGNYVGVYRSLSKAALQLHKTINEGTYYDISMPPDAMIRDPVTGHALQINIGSIAYSSDGEWMVADMPQVGLVRVHMTDLSVDLFAGPLEPSWYLGLANVPLAISNDGRFVSANTDIFGSGNLMVYDLSTCTDQLDVSSGQQHFCSGKDIWHGMTTSYRTTDGGLLGEKPGMDRPTHIRFINDDSISFSARYAVSSGSVYKAANFVATAPGGVQHKIGLLGLGDSYISGQGAFAYREGTDTANNGCHLSELSYPFILGKEYFNSYNSVACSGAKTIDVINTGDNYKGQVTDGFKWKDRLNKSQIISGFEPGYTGQTQFASTYQPEAMVLSVGGDDIGFSNIVKSCAANIGGGTCYDTYEDRAELVNEMDNTYGKLVNTYTTLRQQSGGARLYVVGYPQIAKVGGDCGLNVHLNSEEVAFSSQLIDYLDGVMQKATQAAGVFYVDTRSAFDGHRLCESGDKAVNGFTVGGDAGVKILGKTINFVGVESYHPTPLGYQLLAEAVAAKTDDLTAPMPVPDAGAMPMFDPGIPLLSEVPQTGRKINWVTSDDSMTDDFVLRGDMQQITVNGTEVQLQPGSEYQVVLHSTPMLLDEGGVDEAGNINTTVHIPADTAPGYHTLHVYGKDMAGDDVDVQKVIYVAASMDDYDGDGIPNTQNACLLMPLSGQDVDQDGIDDACDPTIGPAVKAAVSAELPVGTDRASTLSVSSAPTATVTDSAASALQPASGEVLGETVATASQAAVRPAVATGSSPDTRKLFRLNWLLVLEAALILITIISLVYYGLRA